MRVLVAASIGVCLCASPHGSAQTGLTPRDKIVVSASWVADHLNDRDLVLLQVGRKETYVKGHIPGARFVDYDGGALAAGMPGDAGLALEMLPAGPLREQLASLGISDNSRIVVYAADNYWSPSTRVVLTLDYAGLSNVTWLDGGLKAWTDAGRDLSTVEPPAKTGTLGTLKLRPVVVDAEFVRSHVRTPGFAIVDARARSFYDGIPMQGRADGPPQKLGHIPGSVSAPYDKFATSQAGGTLLRSAQEIEAMFTSAGVKPGDTVIGYCHVGQQATAMLFAARTLGHSVLLYDGSYQDWSQRNLPVENPSEKKDK